MHEAFNRVLAETPKITVKKGTAAEPAPTELSGAITTLAKADGFMEISEKQQFVDAGEEVQVQLLKC
ncbi:MAG: hypothetical protein ACUVTB_05655 [Candidatus Bathycorpusculaceae bacterium]